MLSEFSSQLVAEFIGTFLLMLTISLASTGVGALAPLTVGCVLMAVCFTFGYISEAHFNPAVSCAVFVNGLMSAKRMLSYVLVQVIATTCAAGYGIGLIGMDVTVPKIDPSLVTVWHVFLTEFVHTFALISVVLHVRYSRQCNTELYGFAYGMVTVAIAFSSGGFANVAFNPAVATGAQLVSCMAGSCDSLQFWWIYWCAPAASLLLASVTFQMVDFDDNKPVETNTVHNQIY